MAEWMEYTPTGICCSVRGPDINPINCRRDMMLKQIERQQSDHTTGGSQSALAPRRADGPRWPSGNRAGSRSPILVTDSELIGGRLVAALRRGFLTSRVLARAIRTYVSTGSESYFEAGLLKREQHRGL